MAHLLVTNKVTDIFTDITDICTEVIVDIDGDMYRISVYTYIRDLICIC